MSNEGSEPGVQPGALIEASSVGRWPVASSSSAPIDDGHREIVISEQALRRSSRVHIKVEEAHSRACQIMVGRGLHKSDARLTGASLANGMFPGGNTGGGGVGIADVEVVATDFPAKLVKPRPHIQGSMFSVP